MPQGYDLQQDMPDFYVYDFVNEKDFNSFIRCTKSVVRTSYEYRFWTRYIKDTMRYNTCQFTQESSEELTLDIHHHPISLENIVRIVTEDKLLKTNEGVSSVTIATEVLKLHYANKVGFVVLVKSLHEKFHNGFLQIPISMCHGNWQYILQEYFVPDNIKEIVEKYCQITTAHGFDPNRWTKDQYGFLVSSEEVA